MSLSFAIQTVFLITAVLLTSIWVNNPQFSLYTLQLVGFFILIYFLLNFIFPKLKGKISLIIFVMVVLLLVFSTGGLNSPLLFLVYFLLFGLSLNLEPIASLIFSSSLIVFFAFSNQGNMFDNLIPLFSLVLITPLSLFFGSQYLKVLKQKGKIKILKAKNKKTSKNITAEESNALLWLSLNFKHDLIKIIDLIGQCLERPGFSLQQKEKLRKALKTAKKLLATGNILKEKIDKQTD